MYELISATNLMGLKTLTFLIEIFLGGNLKQSIIHFIVYDIL